MLVNRAAIVGPRKLLRRSIQCFETIQRSLVECPPSQSWSLRSQSWSPRSQPWSLRSQPWSLRSQTRSLRSQTRSQPMHHRWNLTCSLNANSCRCIQTSPFMTSHTDRRLLTPTSHGKPVTSYSTTKIDGSRSFSVTSQRLSAQFIRLQGAKTKDDIYELCEASDFDLEGRNDAGETPLLVKVRDNELDCVTALLLQGADATAKDNQGNGALHLAVTTGNLELIKILIVFGAEINVWNNRKITPRHILACSPSGGNRDTLLHYLHVLGAYRCEDEESFESLSEMIAVRTECQEGCSENGCFNGTPPEMTSQTTGRVDKFLVHVDVSTAMHTGDRVLCLDGGGVRGLVLIQTLLEIEQLTDRPIAECFDWIVGTSTGGILALAIAHGVPMRTFQSLYFQMKDDVFEGGKPYDHNALEKFLKDVFGENTKMTDFKPDSPKVAVTSVLADRLPAKLHLFRNYDPPPTHSTVEETDGGKFTPVKNPKDELIWEAARSTGAAPVYFRPHKNYIDGGMMSNNPTLDALTEIHEYNKAKGESRPERAVDVVVSLGTGLPPTKPSHVPDIHHPDGLFKVIKCVDMVWDAKSLGDLLLHQVTQSESQTVERCSAWCSMIGVPFFRFNPPFDEHIPLDCKDDSKLIDMVWQTKLYLHRHHEQLKTLALLLNRL